MIKLTETREVTPYLWVHPGGDESLTARSARHSFGIDKPRTHPGFFITRQRMLELAPMRGVFDEVFR
jgi:hypothetical protein